MTHSKEEEEEKKNLFAVNNDNNPWVTVIVTGRTQCWLQAVSGWYLSVYCLYLECLRC